MCADWRADFLPDEVEKAKAYFVYGEHSRRRQAGKMPSGSVQGAPAGTATFTKCSYFIHKTLKTLCYCIIASGEEPLPDSGYELIASLLFIFSSLLNGPRIGRFGVCSVLGTKCAHRPPASALQRGAQFHPVAATDQVKLTRSDMDARIRLHLAAYGVKPLGAFVREIVGVDLKANAAA